MGATTRSGVGEPVLRMPSGKAPPRAVLHGSSVRLEPVDVAAHADALYERSHGPDPDGTLWTYLSYGPFADPSAFRDWLDERARSDDPLFFTVIDLRSGKASGMVSYLHITPDMGVIEIGHIWFAPALQRTRGATEAIYLLARLVFDELDYRRLEWKCNALNEASRRAAVRFGFRHEGISRQHLIVKGRNRDSAWYSMLDSEWPAVKANMERWLAADNFDAEGRQRTALGTLNAQAEAGD